MSKFNSKEKGSENERKVCGQLSLWVSDYTRDDVFWRAAMSGGRANLPQRLQKGQTFAAQVGDISAVHELGLPLLRLFNIECKFYKDLMLDAPIFGVIGEVGQFWTKLLGECEQHHKIKGGVIRQNRKTELFATTQKGKQIFDTAATEPIVWTGILPTLDCCLTPFRELLIKVPFKRLLPHCKQLRRSI